MQYPKGIPYPSTVTNSQIENACTGLMPSSDILDSEPEKKIANVYLKKSKINRQLIVEMALKVNATPTIA